MTRPVRRNPIGNDPLDGMIPALSPRKQSAVAATLTSVDTSPSEVPSAPESPATSAPGVPESSQPAGRVGAEPLEPSVPARRRPEPIAKTQKVRATFHLPEHLVDAMRDAVVHLS